MGEKEASNERAVNLQGIRFIIGVAAGKGGVGKSTITANLARAAQRQGLQVGILDADIYGPSLRRMIPDEIAPASHPTLPDRIIPATGSGIKMISMAYFCESGVATAVRAPFANGVISQFLQKVEWGQLDILFIDFPPGTGDIHLTLAQESRMHGMVMITTPQEIALMDVRKAVHMCQQTAIPILGIIENMSYWLDPSSGTKMHLLGGGGGQSLSSETGIPLLGEIPIEPVIAQTADKGEDLFAVAPDCLAAEVLMQASRKILEHAMSLEQMEGQYLKNFEMVWPS